MQLIFYAVLVNAHIFRKSADGTKSEGTERQLVRFRESPGLEGVLSIGLSLDCKIEHVVIPKDLLRIEETSHATWHMPLAHGKRTVPMPHTVADAQVGNIIHPGEQSQGCIAY